MIRKASGYLILLAVFGGIIGFIVQEIGLLPTIGIVALALTVAGLIYFGVWLVAG